MAIKLEINMTNRWLYSLIAVGVLLTLGVGVWAYNSGGPPSVIGHSAEEIEGVCKSDGTGCPSGLGGWTLLVRATEWTEESLTTITSSGINFQTDEGWRAQRIDFGNFNWPASNPTMILLKVKNRADDFCVGGDGIGNLVSGGGTNAKCTDFQYQGTILTKVNNENGDWIQMYINNNLLVGCPDMLGRTSNSGYPGKYGHQYFDTFCIYEDQTHWTGVLNSIKIETADWSPDYSMWEWEIWYK